MRIEPTQQQIELFMLSLSTEPLEGKNLKHAQTFLKNFPHAISAADRRGHTPLLEAAFHCRQQAIVWLLDHGADVNEVFKTGDNALIWAAARGDTEIVQLLLERGADIHQADKKGYTAIAWAHHNGHRAIAEQIGQFAKNHQDELKAIGDNMAEGLKKPLRPRPLHFKGGR